MKKTRSLLLTLAVCLSLCACGAEKVPSAPAETETPTPTETVTPTEEITPASVIRSAELQYPASNGLFKYSVYDTYVEITEYIGEPETDVVTVPGELEGLPVYVVKYDALDSCHADTIVFEEGIYQISCEINDSVHVVLPSTLSSIEYGTFENAYKLESVVIPEGVGGIGSRAFKHCSALKEVTIPSTVTWLSSEAFAFCSALEAVSLPEGLRIIDSNAFTGCESLKTVQIPATVERIGASAFSGSGLETLVIPETVQAVEEGLFAGCSKLKTLTVYNADLKIEPAEGYDFSLLFVECNPDLVVRGKVNSTIAKQCAWENIFFEVIE